MQIRLRYVASLGVCLGLIGCPADEDETGGGSASQTSAVTEGSSSGTAGDTTESTGSTGVIDSCSDLDDEAACNSTPIAGSPCAWVEVTVRSPGACNAGETIGYCVNGSADPGCAPTPGCDGEAFYVPIDDGTLAPFLTCGGPYPPGAVPCQVLDAGGYDTPVCDCICGTSGTSTGGDTGTSTGGDTGSTTG